ncbi:hypothetical protein [Algoriphagus formosus]|uniref:hypothetical protein n=1 Tax=Algoriphagus formosus TaxID=2007308 RepID=UPI003F706415
MRKFIIKYCFGRYWWKLPWQKHYNNTDRGAFWSFNGFLLIALLWWITGAEWTLMLSIPWALLVLYFGFHIFGLGYFSRFPVRWPELDAEQKWYYGQAAQSGMLTKRLEFNSQMMSEWMKLSRHFREKYRIGKPKMNNSPKPPSP